MTTQQKIIKGVFWLGFSVFLAVSIPHLAWVMHAYEPQQSDGLNSIWWPLSYGFAIAIDAVICCLSYVKSTGEKASDSWVAWVFITVLVLMSWYFNLIYAKAHDPLHPAANVWTLPLADLLTITSVGTLTPLIISALPVFIIAYTYVLGKVAHARVIIPQSIEELEAQAAVADRKAAAIARINGAKALEKSSWLKEQFAIIPNALKQENQSFHEPEKELSDELSLNASLLADSSVIEDHQEEERIQERSVETSMAEYLDEKIADEMVFPDNQADTAKRRAISSVTVSFEEAAQLTGYSVLTLKKYASEGKVRRSKRDSNLVLLSSLDGMKNKTKTRETGELPMVHAASNGHTKDGEHGSFQLVAK